MKDTSSDIVVLRQGTEGLSMEDYACAIRNRLPDHEVQFARTPKEEYEYITEADVATGVAIDEAHLSSTSNLKLFACTFSGYNHLPQEQLIDRGVVVTNASGIHAPGIAEQVLGYMLVFSRKLQKGWRRKQRREWRHYQARELQNSTVTIVGLGSIGKEISERLMGFGVHSIGVRYTPSKGGPTDEVVGLNEDELHDALAETDYLVISSPLTDETRGLISKEELITLPPDAVVINVARGPIIDTDALTWAIGDGCIRGAALDVTDPEPLPADHTLWGFDNVMITPHMGGHTPNHWERLADILAQNVRTLESSQTDGPLRNQVLPDK